MPPVAATVRRFTVELRGANRANDMTAMIAAPDSHTMFETPANEKLKSRPAGIVVNRNDAPSRQSPISMRRAAFLMI